MINRINLFAFTVLLIIFVIASTASATKNAPPEIWRSLLINVTFDGSRLSVDPNFPEPIAPSILPAAPLPSGPFTLSLSVGPTELYRDTFLPPLGSSILGLPYFLNATDLKITSSGDQITIPLGDVAVCNENNRCDAGEEGLCSLDCPAARNSSYPRPPGRLIAPVASTSPELTSVATETSLRQFRVGLIAAGISLFLLISVAVVIFGRRH